MNAFKKLDKHNNKVFAILTILYFIFLIVLDIGRFNFTCVSICTLFFYALGYRQGVKEQILNVLYDNKDLLNVWSRDDDSVLKWIKEITYEKNK
jgi:hypothetical protein